jgi:hypothetical protein
LICGLQALTLAGSVMMSGFASGAERPAAPAPAIEEMTELDEVTVHGTRLADRIVKAEDRFYKLYNQLNKDDDYDINCAFVPLEGNSRIDSRMCAPGFYADALVDQVVWHQRCQPTEDAEGNLVPATACYTPPNPDLILMDRADEFARHVMSVIRTDPRLGDMAGELDELHMERTRLARRYLQIKAVVDEERAEEPRYRPQVR